MAAVLPSKIMEIARQAQLDPKKAIYAALGNALPKVSVRNNLLLVATYIEPEKTKGGIIRPQNTSAEDLYLGNMGLVLQKGPQAFKDDERLGIYWDGQDVDLGQWVMFRYSSAWEFHLNGVSVRTIEDREIKVIVDDPDMIVSKPHVSLA